jgi:hypothetical protein
MQQVLNIRWRLCRDHLEQQRPKYDNTCTAPPYLPTIPRSLLLSADASAAATKPGKPKQPRQTKAAMDATRAPVAAMGLKVVVAAPAKFDARLQAAFVSGISSQADGAGRSVWVQDAHHAAVGVPAHRRLMGAGGQRRGGVEYRLVFVFRAATKKEAEALRDGLVAAINGAGVCALRMNEGLTGLCDYAAVRRRLQLKGTGGAPCWQQDLRACPSILRGSLTPQPPPPPPDLTNHNRTKNAIKQDYAEIDEFNPANALSVVSSKAAAIRVPAAARTQAPVCRAEGQSCDGAQNKCCSWGMLDCDLRPGAPSHGTCYSLTGAHGYTCSKLGAECATEFDCCPFLKCGAAGGAPGAPKRCTTTPEQASLSVEVAVRGNYSAEAQQGVMSALRYWTLHEGSGAESLRVVSYLPLTKPKAAEWARDPRYKFEFVIGAPTRPALANAVQASLRALGGGGGGAGAAGAGGKEAGLCGVPVTTMGPSTTICSLAEVQGGWSLIACRCLIVDTARSQLKADEPLLTSTHSTPPTRLATPNSPAAARSSSPPPPARSPSPTPPSLPSPASPPATRRPPPAARRGRPARGRLERWAPAAPASVRTACRARTRTPSPASASRRAPRRSGRARATPSAAATGGRRSATISWECVCRRTST